MQVMLHVIISGSSKTMHSIVSSVTDLKHTIWTISLSSPLGELCQPISLYAQKKSLDMVSKSKVRKDLGAFSHGCC